MPTEGGGIFYQSVNFDLTSTVLGCTISNNDAPLGAGIFNWRVFPEGPRFCDAAGGNYTLAGQSPCLPENNSCEILIGAYGEGCDLTAMPPGEVRPLPGVHSFPNPFNPETEIVFSLFDAKIVTIRIFDSAGRVVRDLLSEQRYPAGNHSVRWEGRDDRGDALPSGVYYCRVVIGKSISSTKLTLLK